MTDAPILRFWSGCTTSYLVSMKIKPMESFNFTFVNQTLEYFKDHSIISG